MRGERMAETPVRLGLLAPFGGITHIRFKGFRLGRLSLCGSPAIKVRIRPDDVKSMSLSQTGATMQATGVPP
jgi:hypothetical protein